MIFSVQYMRAAAALLVLITHSAWKGAQLSTDPLGWFNIGGAGVDLFFIISGYIMCHTVDSKEVNFRSFMTARVKRIIPLYWTLTTIALSAFVLFPGKINSSGGHTNIFLSYMLFPTADKYLIQNGWTLSYEFFFYFLFSFGLFFREKLKYIPTVAMILLLVLIGKFIYSYNYLLKFITNPLLLEFAFGIVVFSFFSKKGVNIVTGLVCIVISVMSFVYVNNYNPEFSRVLIYGIPAGIFFVGMLALEPLFKRKSSSNISIFFKKIGDSSYSLYLVHPFALVILSVLLKKIGVHKFGYAFVFLLVVGATASGYLCYLLIEKNLQRMFKKNSRVAVDLPPPATHHALQHAEPQHRV